MMKRLFLITFLSTTLALSGCCERPAQTASTNIERAAQTLDSLYKHYGVEGTSLLRENFPLDESYLATYTISSDQPKAPNPYAYLWPYSGTFSAVNALMEVGGVDKYRPILDEKVLTGLEEYYDDKRTPPAYSSYISSAGSDDRYYDDDVWLGIDFCDSYAMTGDAKYLDKAVMIWKFIESGIDDKLGGGIYWCETTRSSKNTCSNAPGTVYALKLYMATKEAAYLDQAKALYEWTQKNLQDPNDYLYYDNINLEGRVDKTKFAYNSGQMIQAAVLLYNITKEERFLIDAQNVAKACHNYFLEEFTPADGAKFRLVKSGNIWFTAVMFRGFVELYKVDGNRAYLDDFNKSLDYAWNHSRDEQGLFGDDWSGVRKDDSKWLLTQAAMVEMYARIAAEKF